MIDHLKPYPAMKDSGVSSLGQIPEHWIASSLGRIGQFFKGNGASKADEVSSGVPCVRYGDLYTRHEFFVRRSRSFVTHERSADYTPIRYGDVLFAASGETTDDIGRSAVNLMESNAVCGGDVIIFRASHEMVPEFFGYACDAPPSKWQKARMGRGFTVVHIYTSALKNLVVGIPPVTEQRAIVRFLNHADVRIRRYIGAKQKLIKLLEEQKQAIIYRAVTRGLDPKVRTKPSGVDSVGQIPEHWEVKRGKYFFSEVDERSVSGSEELMSVSHKTGVTARSEKNITMFMAESYVGHKVCRPGDVAVNTMWAWMAAVGVSPKIGIVSPSYGVYRPRKVDDFRPVYLDSLLRTEAYRSEYVRGSRGITTSRLRLYPDDFLRILFIRPPLDEQDQILSWVQRETAESQRAINSANREIALLREWRSRLIADAVTGKLDVREAAAQLPQEAAEAEPLDEMEDIPQDESAAEDAELEAEEAA
jgi:type I restriction enzyme, S subunit